MVEYSIDPLTATFQALANPVRREIVVLLAQGARKTVLEIAAHFQISLNGVSKHLKVLEGAGLLQREISGRTHYCSLRSERLDEAQAWLVYYQQFWHNRLDNLERYLAQQNEQQSEQQRNSIEK